MPKLNALNQQQTEVDMANAPEQFGDFAPAPQPGRNYAFMLPRFDPDTDWNEYDAAEGIRRLALQFGGRKEGAVPPLTVLESPTGKHVGDPVNTRISNEERTFGEKNKDKSAVSPMHYLMVALGEDPSGWSNMKFAEALIRHSNGKFRARVQWQTNCNPKNNIYVWDADQNKSVEQEGTPGCDTKWANREFTNGKGVKTYQIPYKTDEGLTHEFANTFTCHCGAYLRPFVEISNFQPYDEAGVEAVETVPEVEAPVAPAPTPAPAAPPKAAAPKPNGPVTPAQVKPSQTPAAARPAQAVGGPPKPSAPRPAAPAKK